MTNKTEYLSVDRMKEVLASNLYRHMKLRRWKQSDLARASGLGRALISSYVRREAFPQDTSLLALAAALSVEVTELVPGYHSGMVLAGTDAEYKTMSLTPVTGQADRSLLEIRKIVPTKLALQVLTLIAEFNDNGQNGVAHAS